MYFFLKILKDKTSPFGKVKENYFLKLRHTQLAIGWDFPSKILEGCT